MNLPALNKYSTKSFSFVPKGINRENSEYGYIFDSANLEFENGCKSRKSRTLALPLSKMFDQIIKFKDRVFLRFGNTINEISSGEDNTFTLLSGINLSTINPAPDRIITEIDGELYVFPDNIIISGSNDIWENYGATYSTAVKFPFVSAYGFYYNSSPIEGDVCYAAESLNVGVKLKFSWCSSQIFTVIKKEKAIQVTEYGTLYNGVYIWLDKAVPNWQSVPVNATAQICSPCTKPMVKPFYFGFGNVSYQFSGNTLTLNNSGNAFEVLDYPENHLHIGQKVIISGSSFSGNNGTTVITDIGYKSISFTKNFSEETSSAGSVIKVTPILPNVDFAIADDDRLWIVDNSEKKVWASRKNFPTWFYESSIEEDDSWCCALNRKATAFSIFKNQIYCFFESGCTKIFGDNATNFLDSVLSVGGIPSGSEKTVGIIGDTMFYFSYNGINRYNGVFSKQIPSDISFDKSISCTADGVYYYILKGNRIWVYSSESGKWQMEDGEGIKQILNCHGKRCYVRNEGIYVVGNGNYDVDWHLTTNSIFEDKPVYPLNLKLKISSENGLIYSVYISKNGGAFNKLVSEHLEGEKTVSLNLPHIKCDDFKIKIEGTGDVKIDDIYIRYRR